MNTRNLGILCIAGSFIAIVGTLFFQVRFDDTASWKGAIFGLPFSIGVIAGLIGLIQSNGIGPNPVVRAVAFLPVIAFGLNLVAAIAEVTGVGSPDNVLFTVGFFGLIIGMVLVGILTVAAKTWQGWRRFVPLFIILVVILNGATGFDNSLGQAISYGVWGLLGYAVATAEPTPALAQSAAA